MTRTETAERSGSSRGIFRDLDGIAPAESLFRQEEPAAGGTERYHVFAAGDPEEIWAERTADQVMGGGSIFREADGPGAGGGEVDLLSADLAEPGSALPAGIQQAMGASIGADFSGVRVHTGAGADRASRNLSARAFARGQDLYFRSGEYNPGSQEGQHLIAHELAHVAAGGGGIHRRRSGRAEISKPDQELEMVMNAANDEIRRELCQANELIGRYSKMEDVLGEWRLGSLNTDEINGRKAQAEGLERSLGDRLRELEEEMRAYLVKIARDAGNEEEARRGATYMSADETAAELRNAEQDLRNKVGPALDGALNGVRRMIGEDRDDGDDNREFKFPETVLRMMDDDACGQFFKAVSKVRGSAPGNFNFDGLWDVEESEAERIGRQAGNAGAVAGLGTAASSVVAGGLGIKMTVKGKEKLNDHEENSFTAFNGLGAITGAIGVLADSVSARAGIKALHEQENKRGAKIQEMETKNPGTGIGRVSGADHRARVALAGSVSSVAGGVGNVAYSVASALDDETASNIAGVTGAALGMAGGTLGLISDSWNAGERKRRDGEAKRNMRALGRQLRDTLGNMTGRESLMNDICRRLEDDKFSVNGEDSLDDLIRQALDGLENDDQKKILFTLQAIEASRTVNKGAMSKAREDAAFSAIGVLGGLASLAGSIASLAGSNLFGWISCTAGTLIGAVGMARNAMGLGGKEEERQAERNREREEKVKACQAAVGRMAVLPELPLGLLREKRRHNILLTKDEKASAEQHASVFSIIKTSNVDMVDFLYAVERGSGGSE